MVIFVIVLCAACVILLQSCVVYLHGLVPKVSGWISKTINLIKYGVKMVLTTNMWIMTQPDDWRQDNTVFTDTLWHFNTISATNIHYI